jgi:DNA-binding MarR family transcriptional regulator
MDKSFHYLLMITESLFQKKVWKELNLMGLTPGQPKVLDYLSKHNGCIQKMLATGCQIDPATMTGILNRMEKHGLVERKFEHDNRRCIYVYLTDLGREKQLQLEQIFIKAETEALAGIEPNQCEQIKELLLKICENMIDLEVLQ